MELNQNLMKHLSIDLPAELSGKAIELVTREKAR